MKHTKGPWTLETVRTQVGHCHKIGPFPSTGTYRHETSACVYVDGLGLRPEDAPELLANARLIAAAPDLLEACKVALQYLEPEGGTREQYAYSLCEEAVKKAEEGE